MKVRVPEIPRTGPGRLEELLAELGYPADPGLDEDSQGLVDHYEGLLEEIAALARRGWVCEFDSQSEYELETYLEVIARLVRAVGVNSLDYEDGLLVVMRGAQRSQLDIGSPEHEGDWMDVEFIATTVDRIVATHEWRVVGHFDDRHSITLAVVPIPVWAQVESEGLAGVLATE